MDTKRAIEILDPERAERFDSIEPVNEACRIAVKALQERDALKRALELACEEVIEAWD